MKLLFLWILFTLLCVSGISQKDSTHKEMRAWINVNVGVSIPVFKFGSPGAFSSQAASSTETAAAAVDEALPGTIYTVSGFVPILLPNIGLTLETGYSSYSFDANAYTHVSDYASNLPGAVSGAHGIAYKWSAGSYYLTKVLPGVFYCTSGDLVKLLISLRIGLAACQFPNISYTASRYDNNHDTVENISIDKSRTNSLAIELNTSLKFHIYKKFGASLGIDFFSCNSFFPFSMNGTHGGTYVTTAYVTYRLFDFTAGLTFGFGK